MGHASHRSRHRHHHDPWGRHGEIKEAAVQQVLRGPADAEHGAVMFRTGLLSLLSDKPMHGYDLIRELEERSGGAWRPSPGSIYPTLQLLEDEGLVTGEEQDGKRVYTITDAGRAALEERRAGGGSQEPWELGPLGEGLGQLRESGFQLASAAMQVARTGCRGRSASRRRKILAEARKKLYALLAQD